MPQRRLPPLNALKAFEAAARHQSFTRAAEELCVTQGAVSHQVKALEVELGMKLFIGQRNDARGLLGLLGPDDGGTVTAGGIVRQRQDRERPRRQEVLLGPAVVIALMGDGGDDGSAVRRNRKARTGNRQQATGNVQIWYRDASVGTDRRV